MSTIRFSLCQAAEIEMKFSPAIAKRSIRSSNAAQATVIVTSLPTPGTKPIRIEARASDTELDFNFKKKVRQHT